MRHLGTWIRMQGEWTRVRSLHGDRWGLGAAIECRGEGAPRVEIELLIAAFTMPLPWRWND